MSTTHILPLELRALVEHAGSQIALAERCGIDRPSVSNHASGKKPVSAEHLVRYLQAAPLHLRPRLFGAWVADFFPADVRADLTDGGTSSARVADVILEYRPTLDECTRQAFAYLAAEAAADPELAQAFRAFARRFGWHYEP